MTSKKGEVKPVEFSITPESLENVKEVVLFTLVQSYNKSTVEKVFFLPTMCHLQFRGHTVSDKFSSALTWLVCSAVLNMFVFLFVESKGTKVLGKRQSGQCSVLYL